MNAKIDPSKFAGFYGNTTEVFYFTPSGRVWLVASEDELPEPREVSRIPADIEKIDQMVTPEEAINYCQQIQELSGEILLTEA